MSKDSDVVGADALPKQDVSEREYLKERGWVHFPSSQDDVEGWRHADHGWLETDLALATQKARDAEEERKAYDLYAAGVLSHCGRYESARFAARLMLDERRACFSFASNFNAAKIVTIKWIVTEGNDPSYCGDGELGVEVNGVPYLYYKQPIPKPSEGGQLKYRPIEKREFGEVIRRPESNSDAAKVARVKALAKELRGHGELGDSNAAEMALRIENAIRGDQ